MKLQLTTVILKLHLLEWCQIVLQIKYLRMDVGLEIFLNSNSGLLMQKSWEALVSVSKCPLSHRGTEEALCLWLQSIWLWDNMNIWDLISHSWLSPDHVLQRHTQKKSLLFPCISYIFFPFIHFKSHCQTPGNKQFQSHLLPKSNWCSQKKKKKVAVFLAGQTT